MLRIVGIGDMRPPCGSLPQLPHASAPHLTLLPLGVAHREHRSGIYSPSGSTCAPGPPPPAPRGRSPATGRSTRSEEEGAHHWGQAGQAHGAPGQKSSQSRRGGGATCRGPHHPPVPSASSSRQLWACSPLPAAGMEFPTHPVTHWAPVSALIHAPIMKYLLHARCHK